MKTPSGIECKYFYGDYFRGRNVEECRLLQPVGERWHPVLCQTCPVPGILRANSCEHMSLHPRIAHPLLAAFQARVEVQAYCRKTSRKVDDPHIGCGECHQLPPNLKLK
jgi:hypothetical protein